MDLVPIFIGIIVIAVVYLFLAGEKGIYYGYLFWIWLFMLGQRTYHVVEGLSIHPLQVVLVLIVVRMLMGHISLARQRFVMKLPALYAFALFWPYGFVVGSIASIPYPNMLSILLNYIPLLLMPMMLGNLVSRKQFWADSARSFFFAGGVISILGIVEHMFPGTSSFFPSADLVQYEFHDGYGFNRAGFQFWGGPSATIITALGLPFVMFLFSQTRGLKRILVVAAAAISFVGIYLGGYRSLWLVNAILVAAVLMLRFRRRGIILSCVLLTAAYYYAPEAGKARFQSVTTIYSQNMEDSSLQKRWGRAQEAFSAMTDKPWGWGFAASGWVHCDFLQIGVELSVIALGIFLFWYLSTLSRLIRRIANSPRDDLLVSLTGSLIVTGGLFLLEGVTVSAWLVIPCWFVWILAEVRLRELTLASGVSASAYASVGPMKRKRAASRLVHVKA